MTLQVINPTSAEGWRGDRGSAWLKALDGYEAMLLPLGEALFERADLLPNQSVVDVGCGGGWTSRMAAWPHLSSESKVKSAASISPRCSSMRPQGARTGPPIYHLFALMLVLTRCPQLHLIA